MIYRIHILALLAALILGSASAIAQDAPTPFLPVSQFGQTNADPQREPLTAGEAEVLDDFVEDLGDRPFPMYPYSGCQDRAQAAYMMLPAQLQAKAMKVWVASPAVYTIGMPGYVRLNSDSKVNWGHHVALAFQIGESLQLYDPVLAPGKLIDQAAWMGVMNISPFSFWTLTKGDVYLFWSMPNTDDFAVNHDVWTGNTAPYFGTWVTEGWVPRSLARDAVGVDALAGNACPELNELAARPDKLQKMLLAGPSAAPAACRPSFDKFESERRRWATRIDSPAG